MIVCDICKVDLSSTSSYHQIVTVEPKVKGVFAMDDSVELKQERHFCGGCAKMIVNFIKTKAEEYEHVRGIPISGFSD